jgi:hypothetical protein
MDPKAKITIWDRTVGDKAQVIKNLRLMPVVELAVKKANVGRSTFYRWKAEDKEFAKAVEDAQKEGILLMNDMSEAELLAMVKDRKFPAVNLWLKTHHPKYANRLEISGELTTREEDELSPEQQNVVRQALKFAEYKKKYGRQK